MKRLAQLVIAERTVIVMIVINSIALFMLSAQQRDERWGTLWSLLDYLCVVYFMLEIGFKLRLLGTAVYFQRAWNRFDFIVVVTSLPVLLTPIVNLQDFAAVLLLRMGRLMRLFRLLWFIPRREHLWLGIKRALRASFGVLLALTLLNVILSIGATMLFGEVAPQHFGNPFVSMFTTFRLFTMDAWSDITAQIAAHEHSLWWEAGVRIYFVVVVVSGGMIGLSLANAVFVDQMVEDNTDPLETKIDRLHEEVRSLREEIRNLKADGGAKK